MHQQPIKKNISLRFRRWSRAGFAVFRSLGKTVTIGCVQGGIAEKEMLKSGYSFIARKNENEENTCQEEDDDLITQETDTVLFIQTLDFAAAGSGNHSRVNYLINHIG